jgi:hypothetical protein
MQQILDRMLTSPQTAVGTSGTTAGQTSATITVDRDQLERLRRQLDAMLVALDRGR